VNLLGGNWLEKLIAEDLHFFENNKELELSSKFRDERFIRTP
tara:strand:- start:637 stop:762 length:126 start_codon:yes stop_codon:yes gene_type:complete